MGLLIALVNLGTANAVEGGSPVEAMTLDGIERLNNENTGRQCKIEILESSFSEKYPGCIRLKAKVSFFNSYDSKANTIYQVTLGTPVNKYPDQTNSVARCELGDLSKSDSKLLLVTLEKLSWGRARHYFLDFYPNDISQSKLRIHYVGIVDEHNQDCQIQ